MHELAIGSFISIIGAAIAWLVNKYFTSLEKRIDKIDHKNIDIDSRLEALAIKQAETFNAILGKFSNWEDRIKVILDSIMAKNITSGISDVSTYMEISMKDFDKKTMIDIESLRAEIRKIEVSTDKSQMENARIILRTLSEELEKIKIMVDKENDNLKSKISSLHLVCKSINADHKRLDGVVKFYIKENMQKIHYSEKK